MATVSFGVMLAPRIFVGCCGAAGGWSDDAVVMRAGGFIDGGVAGALRIARVGG